MPSIDDMFTSLVESLSELVDAMNYIIDSVLNSLSPTWIDTIYTQITSFVSGGIGFTELFFNVILWIFSVIKFFLMMGTFGLAMLEVFIMGYSIMSASRPEGGYDVFRFLYSYFDLHIRLFIGLFSLLTAAVHFVFTIIGHVVKGVAALSLT